MPSISSIPAVDAAFGLFFLYFLLSLVCSAANELITTVTNLRAKTLEEGVRSLLGEQHGTAVFDDARVTALMKGGQRKPSYIPPRVFALAALDALFPEHPERDVFAKAWEKADAIQFEPAKRLVKDALLRAGGSAHQFREEIERSFDDVMDRVSGWYKRKVQWILLGLALVVAVGLNADSIAIGNRLLKDDTLRAAVVAQAQGAVNAGQASSSESQSTPAAFPTKEQLDTVAERVDKVKSLGLPLGWSGQNTPADAEHWLWKALGILLTTLALSLGAPFWFDLLGKFAQLRGVGNRIGTGKDDTLAPVDRDDRSRRTVRSQGGP